MNTPDRRRRIVTNTVAQVAGRNLVAVGRLVVAGLIVRLWGAGTFGEYALVFGILGIAEWLVDFGTTEIFVRELCREPERRGRLVRVLAAAKLVQAPVAFAALALLLVALRYPTEIVRAGLLAGASLAFMAGVFVYRAIFRADLTMEREAAAELLSVLVMIPLVMAAGRAGGGLSTLMVCHLLSRAVYFAACVWLGRGRHGSKAAPVGWTDVQTSLLSTAAVGTIGLMAGLYEAMDLLLLSKLGSSTGLAYYSAGQRLLWPMLTALTAIGGTLYPIAASHYPRARDEFQRACQRGVDTVVLFAGLAFGSVLAGAEFFLGLLGRELKAGAPVLRLLAVLCFVKAITATVGPLLYIVHAQGRALRFVCGAVVLKLLVVAPLAYRLDHAGVALGTLAVELVYGVTMTVYLFQRAAGFRLAWDVTTRAAAATAVAALAARWLFPDGGVLAALTAPLLFALLAFATRAALLADVQLLLSRRTA